MLLLSGILVPTFKKNYLFYLTILYLFCHTLTWILHGCTCVPHPEAPSHHPPHPIPLGHPSAPALSILPQASNLDWRFFSRMIIYMFQCHSPISSHPRPTFKKYCLSISSWTYFMAHTYLYVPTSFSMSLFFPFFFLVSTYFLLNHLFKFFFF